VLTTVSLLPTDTTLLLSTSCDPTAAGVFTQNLSNQFGCDSLVLTTVSLLPTDTTQLSGSTCDPSATGVFTQNLSNQFGCDSLVLTTVSLLPTDTTLLFSSTCDPTAVGVFTQNLSNQFGCDSLVLTTVSLLPTDTTLLFSSTCDPTAVGVFTQNLSNQFGCDSLVLTTVSLAILNSSASVVSDYQGFAVSCAGETDGVAQASANGGIGPYTFNWSNGANNAEINGLAAGSYTVTITDANACSSTSSVALLAPDQLAFSFLVNGLGCFGGQNGSIVVEAQGGVAPFQYSLGNTVFQDSPSFNNLDAGTYTITTMDANACKQTEIILVNAAIPVEVDLGDDQTISLGGSTQLQAIVNLPIDSILEVAWTPPNDDLECPNCLELQVAPFISTTYSVQVTALNGCSGTDNITIFVDRSRFLFVPNVFSPNDDGQNDRFGLFPKPGTVRRFKSFQIFDRWGEQVFAFKDFTPADNIAWDGFFKGRAMNPGVFVWTVEVEFVDGVTESFQGNVTLVR
jgi:gliding motility-associated-like protein